MVVDGKLLDELTAQAKASPRLRMNFDFHQSLGGGVPMMVRGYQEDGDRAQNETDSAGIQEQ